MLHILITPIPGKIGGRGVAYYMSTTICAVILGIILVSAIRPGAGSKEADTTNAEKKNVTTADTMLDLVRNLFPPNIIGATFEKVKTEIIYPVPNPNPNSTIQEDDKNSWDFKFVMGGGSNILGLIVASLVFGIAIASVGEKAQPVLSFFSSITEVMMLITSWIIKLAPIGVCFLVAGQILEMKDVGETFRSLGWYFATVLIGIFIHGGVVLPTVYGNQILILFFYYQQSLLHFLQVSLRGLCHSDLLETC